MKKFSDFNCKKMLMLFSSSLFLLVACSDDKEYTDINKVAVESSDAVTIADDEDKSSTGFQNDSGSSDSGAKEQNPGSVNDPGSGTSGASGGNVIVPGPGGGTSGNGGTGSGGSPDMTPKVDTDLLLSNYYNDTLSPLMRDSSNSDSCVSCHVGPRVVVTNRGPEKVVSDYKYLVDELKKGSTSTNNALMNKLNNSVAHGGGNRCLDPEASPCKEFIEWGKIFYQDSGKDEPGPPLTTFGDIVNTDWDGTLYGYGINPADSSATVTVELYKDAPFDQGGVLVAEIVANQVGVDGDTPGNHAFKFKIPDAQITSGTEMKIYGYSLIDGEKKPFLTAEIKETWYVPSAAGEAYFTNTVLPALNSCSGCHPQRTLRGAFGMLVDPKPSAGGSATNNFFNRKTGNQITHGGGNRCGGGSPCDVIAAWWNVEFAN